MCRRHGDWGRDGVVAVATRHLGWRWVERVGKRSGGNYGSMGQGVRRFWRMTESRPELAEFVERMRTKWQK